MINDGANLLISARLRAETMIGSGSIKVYDLGTLAIYAKVSVRFMTEFLEDCRVIPCGTYELISQDLTEDEIMIAAKERING